MLIKMTIVGYILWYVVGGATVALACLLVEIVRRHSEPLNKLLSDKEAE